MRPTTTERSVLSASLAAPCQKRSNISDNNKIMPFQRSQPTISQHSKCHAELAASELSQVHSRDLYPVDYYIRCDMLEEYNKLQPKPEVTDESNVARQTIMGRAATRTHQQGDGELHQVSDCLPGCGCQWWSLRTSAVTLSVSKSAFSSHHQQTGSFQSHQQTTGEDNARNAEKWGGLSWLK